MAEPARKYDTDPPRPAPDPTQPFPGVDPLGPEQVATDARAPAADLRNPEYARRRGGNGLLIAVAVVILVAIAFYIFGPGATESTPPPSNPPATTTTPAQPAPSGTQ